MSRIWFWRACIITIWAMGVSQANSVFAQSFESSDEHPQHSNSIAHRVRQGTVRITASVGRQRLTGTGVILRSHGVVITALHVVAGAQQVFVRSANGEFLRCTVVARNANCDLAVLEIREKSMENLSRASLLLPDEVSSIERVLVAGHPHSGPFQLQSAYSRPSRQVIWNEGRCTSRLQPLSISLEPGYSGGGVFNARTGDLIGLAVADGSSGYFLPISKIVKTLIDGRLVGGSPSRSDHFQTHQLGVLSNSHRFETLFMRQMPARRDSLRHALSDASSS